VSGLAQGIDAAAHEGALEGSGSTIAVVGTGLDRLYPRKNLALGQLIAESGLLLSEYALGTPPLAAHFPQRNRIIAGLGLGTLVVEAALQSGSLITARLAIESGRDVMAIPGSIHSPQARGCHALIKQGAKLVESTEDILEELGISPRTNATPMSGLAKDQPPPDIAAAESGDEPDPVLRALGWSPATLDVLQVRTGLSASELTVRLLELELAGAVTLSPGQIFQRLAQA
jgi:DNA processing protein